MFSSGFDKNSIMFQGSTGWLVLLYARFDAITMEMDKDGKRGSERKEFVANPSSSGEADEGLSAR